MGRNKVVYGSKIVLDLTGDTVSPDTLLKGYTAYDASGELITGEMEMESSVSVSPDSAPSSKLVNKVIFDGTVLLDLSSVTVCAGALLKGVVAHNKYGQTITGTLTGLAPAFIFPFEDSDSPSLEMGKLTL